MGNTNSAIYLFIPYTLYLFITLYMPNPRENFPRINHLNEYLDYDIKKEKFIVLVDAIPVTRKEFSFDDMIRTTNIEKREELKKLMMEFCKFE